MRGYKYERAGMPLDAFNSKLRLLTGVDAAKTGLMMGCWGGFRRKNGFWSNKLILGRSLLAKSESIPKDELEALCAGSNMSWVVRNALQDWVETSILFSDSTIALCWLTSEKLRLSLFHRNRVLQVRRGSNLEDVFHVKTEANPADCGTRPDKVKLIDIGPDSRWENGDKWMNSEIDKDGVTRSFPAQAGAAKVSETRWRKLKERADYSDYLVLPTKHSFPRTVRIYGYIISFVRKTRKGRKMLGELL